MWVKVKALVSVLSLLIIGIISLATAQPCNYTANFTINSTYGKNRDLVLASLPTNVTANDGFFTTTIGQDSNKVYVLGMCSDDKTSDACYDNLNTTVRDLISSCPNQKEAFSWGGSPTPSLVRYANREFFGTPELEPTTAVYNTGDIGSNLTTFDTIWESLMLNVVRNASMGSSKLKYATGEADLPPFRKIYSLMQCTPDLSQEDCEFCLRELVIRYNTCCHGKQGGVVSKPSCWFRWDLYPFYESNPATTAPSLSPPPPPASPPPPPPPPLNPTKDVGESSSQIPVVVIVIVPIVIFVAAVILVIAALTKRRKKRKQDHEKLEEDEVYDKSYEESLQFDFDAIRVATNNFSDTNKLGQGGFGSVYKGKLYNGQEVAVKRLSVSSGQGQQEFTNEVLLLAKLQHRNLVRLLGFSWQQRERILIYEFLPNSSLDRFIFDPIKRVLLNWEKRYKIIEGIAKGILYLHEDSQYRIIHRDLKAANILLDEEMHPKISDFGMAKLFSVDQSQADISRIVGTFGYMAPEYVRHGQCSVKSDVYGFGVLVLEIISGQKVNSFPQEEVGESLLTYAWKNWNEGTALELVDPILRDGSSRREILRCIHLGLLCVQQNIAYRPNMASVVLMLSSSSVSLPVPLRPEFFMHSTMETGMDSNSHISDQSKSKIVSVSVNEASLSELDPR